MNILAFDTETTGLVRNRTIKLDLQPEVIEFYACLVNLKTGKISKELDTFIKPSKPLSDKPVSGSKKTISQITGITNDMLKDAPSFKDMAKPITKLLAKGPIVVAHNARFDCDMIEIECQRLGLEIQWPRVICTVEQTKALKGYRLTLTKLYAELFGEVFEGAHRAKVDVAALVRICRELFKRGMI